MALPVLYISFFLLVWMIPLQASAKSETQGLLGQNLSGVRQIVSRVHQKTGKNYSVPQDIRYQQTPFKNECKSYGSLMQFKNSSVTVELNGSHVPGAVDGVAQAYFYFTPPVSSDQAFKMVADFFPFLQSKRLLKKSVIGANEGNECTPSEGGIRYQDGHYQLELFYGAADPSKHLIDEAWVELL